MSDGGRPSWVGAQVPPPPPAGEAGVRAPERSAPGGPGHAVPWTWVDALLVFALVLLAGAFLVVALTQALPDALGQAWSLVVSTLVLGLMTLGYVAVRYPGRAGMLLGPVGARPRDWAAGVGIGLAAFLAINVVLGLVIGLLADVTGAELPTVQEELRRAAQDPSRAPYVFVAVVLIAPVCEELFFRGMVFQALRRHLGPWPGIVLSAVVFALVHFQAGDLHASLLVFAKILPLGVFLAWLFHTRGRLILPILVHAVFNLVGVLGLMAGVG